MTQGRNGRFAASAIVMIASLHGSCGWGRPHERAALGARSETGQTSIRYRVVDPGTGFQVEPVASPSAEVAPTPPTSVILGQAVHFDAALLGHPRGGYNADR